MATEKVKKPFYKKWWVWLLALIVVGAIATSGEETVSTPDTDTTPKAEATETPAKEVEVKEEPKNDPNISKAEFDKIENGMTYEEVVAIIGGEGEVMSEVGEKGTQYYTIMYSYEGEKGWGANANFTFQNGKLQSKAQFGLE